MERLSRAALLLTPIALIATLLSEGHSGINRWIQLGPLNWNVAFLMVPSASVAFATEARNGPWWTWLAVLAMGRTLGIQPDASQATAYGAAVVFAFVTAAPAGLARAAAILCVLLSAGFAWTRPDPSRPVPEVEGILSLAQAISPSLAVVGVTALAAVAASPLLMRNSARAGMRVEAGALSVYFAVCVWMPQLGTFPVPLVGMVMSPILGFWLGSGVLTAAVRESEEQSARAGLR